MAGTKDRMAGRLKERAGRLTGDRRLAAKGKTQHTAGHVEGAADAIRDKAEDVADRLGPRSDRPRD